MWNKVKANAWSNGCSVVLRVHLGFMHVISQKKEHVLMKRQIN